MIPPARGLELFVLDIKYEQSANPKITMSQTVATLGLPATAVVLIGGGDLNAVLVVRWIGRGGRGRP